MRPPNEDRSMLRQFLYRLEAEAGDTLSDEAILWLSDRPTGSAYFDSNETLINLQITKFSLPAQGETEVAPNAAEAGVKLLEFVVTFPPRAALENLANSLGIGPLPPKESLMREILYAAGGTAQMAAHLDSMPLSELEAMAEDLRRKQRA